ncbi:MAG: transposase [Myxococcaceae bacterium]|nr:MAG: transposase [Myxococcaceae bacterium]
MREDALQRLHSPRTIFNALRWIVRAGAPWRILPNDLPPWELVYQQTQRWIGARVFEAMASDLRALLLAEGRHLEPSAVIFCSTA